VNVGGFIGNGPKPFERRVVDQIQIFELDAGVGPEIPVEPPAFGAMAIDDPAQFASYFVANSAA
jgi:hypothetical protein